MGFGKYIISATTPFLPRTARACAWMLPAVVSLRAPGWQDDYARRGWRMFPSIDRVYDNALARRELGWRPNGTSRRLSNVSARPATFAVPWPSRSRRERLSCRAVRRRALSGDGQAKLKFAAWMRLDCPGRDAASLEPMATEAGCFGARSHSFMRAVGDGRLSGGGRRALGDQVWTDQRLSWRPYDPTRDPSRRSQLDAERRRRPRLRASGRPGLRLHARDQRAAIVRLALPAGQRAQLPVVWFDLDSASLVELPQSYERRSEASYWYAAPTVPYQALLGDRAERLRSVLSGSLAARGVNRRSPASAASRSMRKARAAGSV